MHATIELRPRQLPIGPWTITAVVAGQGPPILLLHGLGGSWHWWRPAMAALANEFTVCAIDLPGAGSSSPLTVRPQPETYKALVGQLLERLDLGSAIVVGHSLGGYVAVQAAIQRTPGVRAIALVAPFGFGPIRSGLLRLLSFPVVGELLMRLGTLGAYTFLHSLVHDPGSISDKMLQWARLMTMYPENRGQFLFQLRLAVRFGRTSDDFIIDDTPALSLPMRLLWGSYDPVFPIEIASHAQRVLHAPPPVVFGQSGHLPQLEEPERFHAELRSFARGA